MGHAERYPPACVSPATCSGGSNASPSGTFGMGCPGAAPVQLVHYKRLRNPWHLMALDMHDAAIAICSVKTSQCVFADPSAAVSDDPHAPCSILVPKIDDPTLCPLFAQFLCTPLDCAAAKKIVMHRLSWVYPTHPHTVRMRTAS